MTSHPLPTGGPGPLLAAGISRKKGPICPIVMAVALDLGVAIETKSLPARTATVGAHLRGAGLELDARIILGASHERPFEELSAAVR